MIEQAKSSVCVCVCLVEKAKSLRPDVVHTRLDGMLLDKRSIEPSTSGRFTLEAEKHREICRNFFFPNVSFRTRMYK
jgi:DNA polymerase II large subunit